MRNPHDGIPRHMRQVRGFRMCYVDEGEGRPVVLVHGSPIWSFAFREQILALADDVRVVAPDLPTFGGSSGPHLGADFVDLANALSAFLDGLELDDIHLVGHDWGGSVAAAVAARAPERIRGLTLVNTTVRADYAPPRYWQPMVGPLFGELTVVKLNLFGLGLPLMLRAARRNPAWRAYWRPFQRESTRRTVLRLERLEGFKVLMAGVEDTLRDALGGAADDRDAARISIIWGTPDAYFGAGELVRLSEAFPTAPTHVLVGAGHFPMEDGAAAFTRVLRECVG